MSLEARCTRTNCGETFVLHGIMYADKIHGVKEDGFECGGIGIIEGEWIAPGTQEEYTHRVGDMVNLTAQEEHALREPDCIKLDCKFHHPDESYTDWD